MRRRSLTRVERLEVQADSDSHNEAEAPPREPATQSSRWAPRVADAVRAAQDDLPEPKDDADKHNSAGCWRSCRSCSRGRCDCWGRCCAFLQRNRPQYTALQVRKRFRICLLTIVVLAEIIFVAVCATRLSSSDPVRVPVGQPLDLSIADCKLHFEVVDSSTAWLPESKFPVDGHATVWYDLAVPLAAISGKVRYTLEQDSAGTHVTFSNRVSSAAAGMDRSEACTVHVAMLRSTTLSSLSITCNGQCVVTTDMPVNSVVSGAAWAVSGAVSIDTTQTTYPSSVLLREVDVGSLRVRSSRGDVFLEDVLIQGASSIVTQRGNVFAKLRSDMELRWTDSTSYYCLAAPSAPQVATAGLCNETAQVAADQDTNGSDTTTTLLSSSCDGTATLCTNNTICQAAATPLVSLNLTVPAGSFYATRRATSDAVADLSTHAGVGFNRTAASGRLEVQFDGYSQVLFEAARTVLEDESRADTLYTIQGPPGVRHVRPANGYLYTVSPSVAHAQMGPWWLAFFSWGLLVKKVEVLTVDLQTGPCPYNGIIDLDGVGDIYEAIKTAIVPSTQELAYVSPHGKTPGVSRPYPFDHEAANMWDHFIRQSEDWYTLPKTGEGHYTAELVDITKNPTLVAALVISVLVSILVAGMIQWGIWQLLSTGVLLLSDYGSHIHRYEKVLERARAEPADTSAVGEEPDPRQPKTSKFKSRADVAVTLHRLTPNKVAQAPAKPPTPGWRRCCMWRWWRARCSAWWPCGGAKTQTSQARSADGRKTEGPSAMNYVIQRGSQLISMTHMPPLFSLIDHAIFVVQQSYLGDSLEDFLSQKGVIRESAELGEATSTPPPTLTRFKNVYSQYCFLLEKEEKHLRAKESVDRIEKSGFKLEPLGALETPDAFTSIRFKTQRELVREAELATGLNMGLLAGETSLDFFLRDQCKITHFTEDRILVDEFKARYSEFCQRHRLTDAVTVSKALMAQKNITAAKVATFRIIPAERPGTGDRVKTVKLLDMDKAELHNKSIMEERQNINEDSYLAYWWLVDSASVMCHLVVVALVAFFPVTLFCCFQVAAVYSFFSTKMPEELFAFHTMLRQPSWVFNQILTQFPYFFMYLVITGIAAVVVGYAELLFYYSEEEFFFRYNFLESGVITPQGHKPRRLRGRQRMRRWVHTYQWFQVTLTLLVASFLLGEVMVWCILGAMLNPNAFLAYATAVLTFVTFATTKWAQMQTLFNQSFDEIVMSTQGVVGEAINRTLKTLIEFGGAELGNYTERVASGLQDVLADVNNATGGVLQQQVLMLSGGGLGKNIMSAGFDISTVVGVATGKIDALQAFAEQSNVPIEIVHLLNALADGSSDEIVKAIRELLEAHQPSSLFSADLAVALAELAFKPTRPKVDKCIKALYKHVLPAIIRLCVQQVQLPQELAQGAEAVAGFVENSSEGLMSDIQAAKALFDRLTSGKGLLPEELELVRAQATITVQKALAERPQLLHTVTDLDLQGVESAVQDILKDQGLQKMLLERAAETVLILLRGITETRKKTAELSAAALASGVAESLYQGANQVVEVVDGLVEAACKDLQKALAFAAHGRLGGLSLGSNSLPTLGGLPRFNGLSAAAAGLPGLPTLPGGLPSGMSVPSLPGAGAAGLAEGLAGVGAVAGSLGGAVGGLVGIAPDKLQAAQELLMGVLPPLLKGIMSLGKELDYQKFVESLRYVHDAILQQKMHFASIFGDRAMVSFESLGPIFHVLDLALGTRQIQAAITNILEDRNVLSLPPEISKFINLVFWFRIPASRQQALRLAEVGTEFMVSWSGRQKLLKDSLRFFKLDPEMLILLELVMGLALNDIRSLTNESVGIRIAECVLKVSGKLNENMYPEAKEVLGRCFQIALDTLATMLLNDTSQMHTVLQHRTGLESGLMKEIVDLYICPQTDRQRPPTGMQHWELIRAASAHVGIEVKEAVGLAHLLMGFADTPEVTLLLHEIMRRQDLVSQEDQALDRFITCLLGISFAQSDQSVMLALQELRIKNRFLSAVGLAQLPPRYVSEELLRSVGVKSEEVLRARLDVPFDYNTDPNAWDEWLEKASNSIKGYTHLGPWYHVKSMRADPMAEKAKSLDSPRPAVPYAGQSLLAAQARRERGAVRLRTLVQAQRREKIVKAVPTAMRALNLLKSDGEMMMKSPTTQSSSADRERLMQALASVSDSEREAISEVLEDDAAVAEDEERLSFPVPLLKGAACAVVGATSQVASATSQVASAVGSGAASVTKAGAGVAASVAKKLQGVPELSPDETLDRTSSLPSSWPSTLPTSPVTPLASSTSRRLSSNMVHRPSTAGSRALRKRKRRLEHLQHREDTADTNMDPLNNVTITRSFGSIRKRVEALQLSWRKSMQKEQMVRDLLEFYNTEIEHMNEDGTIVSSMSRAYPLRSFKGKPLAFPMPASETDYIQQHAEQQLRELQDTSTGSLHKLQLSKQMMGVILKILKMELIVKPASSRDVGIAGKRRLVIQEYADLLGVQTADMATFFNLIRPERTHDGMRAISAINRSSTSAPMVEAMSQVTYTIRRLVPVYDEVRSRCWETMWHFNMPRFLGPSVLLPSICYPPQMREIAGIVHFFTEPVLRMKRYNSALQLSLYNITGLICGAPRNAQSLLETFGICTAEELSLAPRGCGTVADLLNMMLRPIATDKLLLMPKILQAILRFANNPDLTDMVKNIFPYLVYFAGFPNTEIPARFDQKLEKQPVLDIISEDTGIAREVLIGIELSQHSISAMSQSDEAVFSRESVLGLLLPVMSAARRIAQNMEVLPTDGMVKALVSLAYCKIDHLEYLAEALGMDTFMMHFGVYLVDLSFHLADAPAMEQILQQIRMSSGIKRALDTLGADHGKLCAMLELSNPSLDNVPSLKKLLDRLGLGQIISAGIMGVLFTSVNCALLHLRGDCDPLRHDIHTDALHSALESVYHELTFSETLVPLLGIRLFQGDFHILQAASSNLQRLMPFTLERNISMAVAGLLGHAPPRFTYNPVVLYGAATLRLSAMEAKDGQVQVKIYTDTPLPQDPIIKVRALPSTSDIPLDPDLFVFEWKDVQKQSFVVCLTRYPQEFQDRRVDIRWHAAPREFTAKQLMTERHRVAATCLKDLEEVCWYERIHWGGAACMWWDTLDVHPLFLLLAAGDVTAIRLASDLLCVPDTVLAFLLASVSLAEREELKPLLCADLCMLPVLEKILCNHPDFPLDRIDPVPLKQWTDSGSDPLPTDTMACKFGAGIAPPPQTKQMYFTFGQTFGHELSISRNEDARQQMRNAGQLAKLAGDSNAGGKPAFMSDSEDSADEQQPYENPVVGLPLTRAPSPEKDFLDQLGTEPAAFPDAILGLYDQDTLASPFEDLNDCMGQALWLRWRFEQRHMRLCSEGTFERAAIDCMEQLKGTYNSFDNTATDDLLIRWNILPDNMHIMLAVMLQQLYALLEDESELRESVGNAPSAALMVCLSKLHQARLECSFSHGHTSSDLAEQYLLPATWALDVHLRSRQERVRREFLAELQNTQHSDINRVPAWALETLGGFTLPSGLVLAGATAQQPEDWEWDAWEWPEDEILAMCCRVAQVTRLALGIARPLECHHLADPPDSEMLRRTTRMVSEQVDEHVGFTPGLAMRGWTALLQGKAVTSFQKRELVKDLLNEQALEVLLVFAAGGADPLEGSYSLQQIQELPEGPPRALFEDKTAIYDALLSMLATSFDEYIAAAPAVTCPKGHSLRRVRAADEQWMCQGRAFDGGCLSVCVTLRDHEGIIYYYCEQCAKETDGTASYCLCERCHDAMCDSQEPEGARVKLKAASSSLSRLLPNSDNLGLRPALWTPQLCWHTGLDPSFVQVCVNVAHGFVEDSKGKLLRPNRKAFEATALRMRLSRDRHGATLLQSLLTKAWSVESCRILATRLRLLPEVVHGLIAAARPGPNQVKGWLDMHRILFGLLQKVAPEAKQRALPGQSQRSTEAAISTRQEILAKQAEKAERFIKACLIFNKLGQGNRGTRVETQRLQLLHVLDRLLPALGGRRPSPISGKADEVSNSNNNNNLSSVCDVSNLPPAPPEEGSVEAQAKSVSALLLHILSNQNRAAAEVMQENPFIHQALCLSVPSAALFCYFSLFTGRGAREVEEDKVDEAVAALTKPLVSFIMKMSQVAAEAEAIPSDCFCRSEPGVDEELDDILNDRIHALLNCMFGMVLQNNNRVLTSIKTVLTMSTTHVLKGNREISRLMRLMKKPMTRETMKLLLESKECRALTLLQSLHQVRRLRDLNSSKKGSPVMNTKGSAQISVFVHEVQEAAGDVAGKLTSGLKLGVQELLGKSVSREDISSAVSGIVDLASVAADGSIAATGSAMWSSISGAVSEISSVSAAPPPPAAFEGRCPRRHRLQVREPSGSKRGCAEWICAGESEPGGCRSGLSALHPTGHLRSFTCEECNYFLCEKCHLSQFQIISGARNPELNGLYIANKALPMRGERFVFMHGAFYLQRREKGYWGVWSGPGADADCYAYMHPHKANQWYERSYSGEGFKENTALRRFRDDNAQSSLWAQESKILNLIQHFFMAYLASDRAEFKISETFAQEFQAFLPILAACGTGRLDTVVSGLQKLAIEAGAPDRADHMMLILDVLTLIGMNKELFYERIVGLGGNSEACILPSLVRRLFGNVEIVPELEILVNRLVNLMVGICIEAPVETINKMIADIIDQSGSSSLVQFAMKLIKGEERTERAAEQLIMATRSIAQQAAEGKSLSQMRLFSRGPGGEKAQIDIILEAVMDLLLPFLTQELRRPIYSVLEVLTDLYDLSTDPTPTNFRKRAPYIATGIASALKVPDHSVSGIFALASGDWEHAIDLCKPFCDLDPQVLHEMMRFLPTIKRTVSSGANLLGNLKDHAEEDYIKNRIKQISGNVIEHKGSALDLFDLVDLDRNGTISLEEFRMCTVRLGFNLGEHRVLEVFSKCKKNIQGQARDLDRDRELSAEEFTQALEYLQHKVATISLSLLGRSLGWLLCKLIYLCVTLILCFIFIFLAMTAFISGGVFSAIVNSAMTIGTGLSLALKDYKDKSSGEDQRSLSAVVEEIQDLVLNDQ